jgi:hypothetical protein
VCFKTGGECDSFDLSPRCRSTILEHRDAISYNAFESERAGLSAKRVIGRNFFKSVGPCTDSYLIAQRYIDSQELDEQLDFVAERNRWFRDAG